MTQPASSPAPKSALFYYGWRIVALGFIINLMSAGIGATGLSLFVKPMGDDLNWSRSSVVAATAVSSIAAALFGHFLGSLLDKKYGARALTTLGTFMIGLAVIGAGQVREVWQFLLLFFIAGVFGLQAYPALITPTIVSKWFVRRRGMAISFASMGLSSSGLIIVPYINFLLSALSWRWAWTILGFTFWGLATPWCFLFMRSRPEDIGLRPDGDPEPSPRDGGNHIPSSLWRDEYPWTIREATRTRSFWLILLASSLSMMAFLGVLVNFFAYATDEAQGFTSGQATVALAAFSALALSGKFFWAFLSDKIDIRYSTAFTYSVPSIGLALLIGTNSFSALILWGVIFGIGISGISPLPPLAWGNYYGRTFLGSIRGVTSPVAFLTQAASPLFASSIYDATGSYELPFAIFLGIFIFSAFLMLLAKKPALPQARAIAST